MFFLTFLKTLIAYLSGISTNYLCLFCTLFLVLNSKIFNPTGALTVETESSNSEQELEDEIAVAEQPSQNTIESIAEEIAMLGKMVEVDDDAGIISFF